LTNLQRILNFLAGNPQPQSAANIARAMTIKVGTVRANLKRAREAGTVQASKQGNAQHWTLATVHVNKGRTTRALIVLLRERQAKHREALATGWSRRERQQARRGVKRTTRRLATLEARV